MAEGNYRKANYSTPPVEKKPIQQHQVDAAVGKPRVRANADGTFTISGADSNTFFGPGQPPTPTAQDPKLGAVGRQFDYLVNTNTQYVPRGEEAVSMWMLRALAENLDVLRLGIETRKDQMAALDWTIQPRDKKKPVDTDAIRDFFLYPDKVNAYAEWQRALLEDRFVLDAMTIYPRFTNGGDLYALEMMDGAMIKPLIDATGRRPLPPQPAYEQIIKGVPAVLYSTDELIYRPYNVRTHKVYGYSPVEQIIVTVNIALRRQMFQLDYYTEGSIPDAFGMLPPEWTPTQIGEFQKYWDALFENLNGSNSAQRRKMRWIPGVKDVKFAKDAILKDEFDEWLARIVCYALSLEPTPFIKQMNRATAENQKDQSRSEGLIPLKKSWKSLMDYIISFYLKRPELEFAWQDQEATDPLEQSQINVAYVNAGIVDANEVREDLGLEPREEPEEDTIRIPNTEVVAGTETPPSGGDPAAPPGNATPTSNAPASAAKFAKLWVRTLRKEAAAEQVPAPKFVSGVDVPYLAGASEDGSTIYFDRHLPAELTTADGTDFDPRDFIAVHEMVEWLLCVKLGQSYDDGHQMATHAEHAAVAARGIDPAEYESLLQGVEAAAYQAAKNGEMKDIPADLAEYPYADGGELALIGKAEKMAKRAIKPINRDRRSIQIQAQRMTRAIKRKFKEQADIVATGLGKSIGKMSKADPNDPDSADKDADEALDAFDLDASIWADWPDVVSDPLTKANADGAVAAADQLNTAGVEVALGKDFFDRNSVQYAQERGAEMVGKRYDGDRLVDNPDAEWAITDETRAGIKSLLTTAMRDGWSNDRFASALKSAYVFSPARAEMIARTETALADSKGQLASWKESGVIEKKQWITAGDDLVSEDCVDNADAGEIDIDDDFPSGDDAPPCHPNCRCAAVPVVSKEFDKPAEESDDDADKFVSARLKKRDESDYSRMARIIKSMPAPQVTVHLHQEPVTVNVSPEVKVEPSTANVVLEMPSRKIEKNVVRDERGLIQRIDEREILDG